MKYMLKKLKGQFNEASRIASSNILTSLTKYSHIAVFGILKNSCI